jgi:hypothetical protein
MHLTESLLIMIKMIRLPSPETAHITSLMRVQLSQPDRHGPHIKLCGPLVCIVRICKVVNTVGLSYKNMNEGFLIYALRNEPHDYYTTIDKTCRMIHIYI